MKRFMLLCLMSIFLVSCNSNLSYEQDQGDYFYSINALIKDKQFSTANVKKSKIILCDEKQEVIEEILFDNYDPAFDIMLIKKDGNIIRFICSGDIDDEIGIVFINDETNSILDGIKHLDRVGGNYYKYSTYE